MQYYDIIGDVHGHAEALERLLLKMGYIDLGGCFRHRERKAVFLGDLIDRGPRNFETLKIVKTMTDNNQAVCLLGNHEFNALCYHTRARTEGGAVGDYIRPHTAKNAHQHQALLDEIAVYGKDRWDRYLEWFRGLPLFWESSGIRAVHACWDQRCVDFIRASDIRDKNGLLTDEFLTRSGTVGDPFFENVETLLKGKEIWLPRGHQGILDKDGHVRRKVRLKWWLSSETRQAVRTYDEITRTDEANLEKLKHIEIPPDIRTTLKREGGPTGASPIFIGHYWFTGAPQLLTKKVACLDYSIARGGHLAAYRWCGEKALVQSGFVRV